MDEETQPPFPAPSKSGETIAKTNTVEVSTSKGQEESNFRGISIRAYLAIVVVGTVCVNEVIVCAMSMVRHVEYAPSNQLYMLASSVLAHYFSKSGSSASSPSTTTTTSSSENKTP